MRERKEEKGKSGIAGKGDIDEERRENRRKGKDEKRVKEMRVN